MNNYLCKKIVALGNLCDFYHMFQEVVSEWMSHQKDDNHFCKEDFPAVSFGEVTTLANAGRVHTVELYKLFGTLKLLK